MLDQGIIDGAADMQLRRFHQGLVAADGPVERLPFTVRMVRTEGDLRKAVQIRHAAYARHVPQFARSLQVPEACDTEDGFVVLLAESKVDGTPLGTIRIQTNRYRSLNLQQSVDLPEWMRHRTMAEATRLGVIESRVGRLVTTVLFKAFYLYCISNQIDAMVVTGRFPIDRQYERLMFDEVYPGMGFVPLSHVGGLPHRVMTLDVATAEARWRAAQHPLFKFIVETAHEDINVGPKRLRFRPFQEDLVQKPSTVFTEVAVKNM